MKTGFTAFKLALAGFLIPYIYVYNPMLLLIDYQPLPFAQAVVTAMIGVFLLAMSTIGFYKAQMAWYLRLVAMGGALLLLIPGTKTDLSGLAILAAIHVLQTMKAKKNPPAPAV